MPESENPSAKPKEEFEFIEEVPVEREHKLGKLQYETVTGRLPVFTEYGEIEAQIFFVYYRLKSEKRRPLTFVFNGGPGSPAIWLHMGALGPKYVRINDDGTMPSPPYNAEECPGSWLPFTDLVMIDPVGTGFSRGKNAEIDKKNWGVQGDIATMAEFVRLFLTRYERWDSPLFVAGESYGTTRAAGLSEKLLEKGVALNGLLLISSILAFQTCDFAMSNHLPYVLFLPTYTATAWYHGKIEGNLDELLLEAEEFAVGEYAAALMKGDAIEPEEEQRVAKRLSELTGLSERFLLLSKLQVYIMEFCKELMRDEGRTVGRLDTRFRGIEASGTAARMETDPSFTAIMAPFTGAFQKYLREELGYKSDLYYKNLDGVRDWDWGAGRSGAPNLAESLRSAMSRNVHLKVHIASGYYDLATPYFATDWTISDMRLDPEVRGNISVSYYPSGHMMYIESGSLIKLRDEAKKFITESSGGGK
ncbi:MAG: S10 family peptidase [Fimbriimonadaceae bacterium]